MSRGFIGCTPCYTPFSSQMSSAVGSIAGMVSEQHRINALNTAAQYNSQPAAPQFDAQPFRNAYDNKPCTYHDIGKMRDSHGNEVDSITKIGQ